MQHGPSGNTKGWRRGDTVRHANGIQPLQVEEVRNNIVRVKTPFGLVRQVHTDDLVKWETHTVAQINRSDAKLIDQLALAQMESDFDE